MRGMTSSPAPPAAATTPARPLLTLGGSDHHDVDPLSVAEQARGLRAADDPVAAALDDAERAADLAGGGSGPAPLSASGLLRRWTFLAGLGAGDLTVARTLEPHLDALAILDEAGSSAPAAGTRWGVFAAGGPGRLAAARTTDGWVLSGVKSWASLSPRLDGALVTAQDDDGAQRLFRVDLTGTGVRVEPSAWTPRGLELIETPELAFDRVEAEPVGEPGWYVERPGFAAGGVGVAAMWFGAAVALADQLSAAAAHRAPDQIALLHIGACRVALTSARSQLERAAYAVSRSPSSEAALAVMHEVRAAVALACEEVLTRVGHGLGPGPLVRDPEHARRVADLTVFQRQHHAERDLAALGALVVQEAGA